MQLQLKTRHGAKVHKVYDAAKTPYQRVLDSGILTDEKKAQLFLADKKVVDAFKKEYNADKVAFGSALMAEPYHVFAPEPEYQGFNLIAVLKKAVKRAEAAEKDHGKDKRTDVTGLADVQALVERLSA